MLALLDHYQQVISNFSASSVAASLAVILEIVLRVVPSSKPMSVLIFLENLATALAAIFSATAIALNKLVPQNVQPKS